jgi:hypothetical protein
MNLPAQTYSEENCYRIVLADKKYKLGTLPVKESYCSVDCDELFLIDIV